MHKSGNSLLFFNNTNDYLFANPIIYLRKKIVSDLLGYVNSKELIDIGCGNGEITKEFLRSNKVTFLDFSTNMLDLVKENINADFSANSTFVNIDITKFKPDKKFDIVICIGVIAHVDNISDFLNKLKEITADEGIILLQYSASEKIISKFNHLRNGLFSKRKYNYNYKVNLTSTTLIKNLLVRTGLDVIKKVKYLPVSPIFSVFNYETKIKLLKYTYKRRLFSFLGSEIILYLSKSSYTK